MLDFLNNIFDKNRREKHAVSLFINELLQTGYIGPQSDNIIDLDWWEPLNKECKLVPGNIYVMLYKSDKFIIQTEFEHDSELSKVKNDINSNIKNINSQNLKKLTNLTVLKYIKKIMEYIKGNSFYEVIPTVLVRKYFESGGNHYIHGINLNYCSTEVKQAILKELYNIDKNYFDNDIWEIASSGKWKYSDTIAKTVSNDTWLKYICNKYKLTNIDLLARTYKIENISKISFVELWMYDYIPYLNYKDCVDGKSLRSIQKMLTETKFGHYTYPNELSGN